MSASPASDPPDEGVQAAGRQTYDSAELRQWLKQRGTKPVAPNRSNRKQPFSFDRKSYKQRHLIENAFGRLKDFRRIFTRYDRLARNYPASVCSRLLSYGGFNESRPLPIADYFVTVLVTSRWAM